MSRLTRMIATVVSVMVASGAGYASDTSIDIVWSVNVDQRLPNDPLALSMPTVAQSEAQDWVVLAARDKRVHVYDMHGSDVRRIRIQAASDSGTLVLHNGLVVLGDTTGILYGIDPELGVIKWQVQLTAGLTSAPVPIGQGFLVQTTDNRIYRFSAEGKKQWSFSGSNSPLSMYINASPLVKDDHVYCLLNNGDALALKAENGDVIWKKQLLLSNDSASLSDIQVPLAAPLLLSSLHMEGEKNTNVLLIPFFQGDMMVVSAEDGTQLFSLPISLRSTPVLSGNMLYMADNSGFLHLYEIEKGKRVWRKKISDTDLIGPVLWKNALWLADNKGQIFQVNMDGDVQASAVLDGRIARAPVVSKAGLLFRTERGVMTLVK